MNEPSNTTHFGFRAVKENEKSQLVSNVFRSVASKYDLMNDLMSFGLHRIWKRIAVSVANLHGGEIVLDVASGTGDLAAAMAKAVGKHGKVVMTDVNEAMLAVGRDKLTDRNIISNVEFVQANAENLPFENDYFDCITIAFGLRNVTDKAAALASMYRVLKPGGCLIILEFSAPTNSFVKKIYDLYSFNIIPALGELITQDKESYTYLVESIRMHPNQDTLKAMLQQAQFEDVSYSNLNNGIVALHKGYKY